MREVPGKGKAARADGEEEKMDGGGILIISHSQGGGRRTGKGAPTGVMLNSITYPPPPPIESLKEYGEDFCPQTKAAGDSQKKR